MHIRLCVSVNPFMSGEDTVKLIKNKFPGIKISMSLNKRIFKFMTYIIKQVPTSGEVVHIYFNARPVFSATSPVKVITDDYNLKFATNSGKVFTLKGETYQNKQGVYTGLANDADLFIFKMLSDKPPSWVTELGVITNIGKIRNDITISFANGIGVRIPITFFMNK